MRTLFDRREAVKIALAIYIGGLIGLLFLFLPDIKMKIHAERTNHRVTLAADWEDVVAFADEAGKVPLLTQLKAIPVSVIVMQAASRKEDESLVRVNGFHILWRLEDLFEPSAWLARFQKGDGVFVADEHVLEHPLVQRKLPAVLRAQQGFLCLMEFVPNKLLASLAKQVPENLIKSHLLPTREILLPKPALWKARLLRAIDSRWVRLLVIRSSPGWTLSQNLDFQRSLGADLRTHGFSIGDPQPFPWWSSGKISSPAFTRARWLVIMAVSMLTPIFSIVVSGSLQDKSPWLVFGMAGSLTFLSGVVIHALGAVPPAVLGLQMVRGVKLQLVLPLFASFFFLFSPAEIETLLNQPLRLRHVVGMGVVLVSLVGIYLMRSSNFPLIPVTDAERVFRDTLDKIFIARPRFKEFLIGHPLFLLGLFQRGKGATFMTDGRLFLWLGLIGQISILNTFLHFHSPFEMSLVRTLHGFWIGCFVAISLDFFPRALK